MEVMINIKIDHNSRKPKYKQIVDSIIDDIAAGNLEIGQKIPSINIISAELYLSRDTVEKAYNKLKEKKIIESVKGKGFYIVKTDLERKRSVFFLINKLSSYKMAIYNAFVDQIDNDTTIDLQIYYCDQELFVKQIEQALGKYDHYVIMPHFKDAYQTYTRLEDRALEVMKKIPHEKLLLLDNFVQQFPEKVSQVYQNFEDDIFNALQDAAHKLKKYKKLILVYPSKSIYPYPKNIFIGFRKFCVIHSFDFEVLDVIYDDMELQQGDVYITITETDLVHLVKQIRETDLVKGKDIGIISYNETPLKDLLGIATISTDFKQMGQTAAELIQLSKKEQYANSFNFIDRESI
ncbi:GntR family transcriptional regulator [Gangjinia marincola]|uniref:GntR family transcriptional regulator n=1 Tax=Gangjinia marincola TaxID=578463 RepID=A0ABN1MJE2_9FLAO